MTRSPHDRSQALEKVTNLFRECGFAGTSVEAVVQASGLNRYAIYEMFGDKRGLFRAALDHYAAEKSEELDALRAKHPDDAFAALREALNMPLEEFCGDDPKCCLFSVAAHEITSDDAELAEHFKTCCAQMRAKIAGALADAQAQGTVRTDISAAAAAALVFTTIMGVAAQVRAGAAAEDVAEALNVTLAALATPAH